MIIPVIWRTAQDKEFVPAWGSVIPAREPAQSPFAAMLMQNIRAAWAVLSDQPAQLLHLDPIGPDCLPLEDDPLIHLLLADSNALRQIWPLVSQVLVLPLAAPTPSWQPVSVDWRGYEPLARQNTGIRMGRISARQRLDQLVRAGGCDLHLHTTASDGTDTPEALFARIKVNRLSSFAVTDHDLLDSLARMAALVEASCRDEKNAYCPVFVPGVEISVSEGRELHVLGYFPLGGQERLDIFLTEQRKARHNRNVAMVEQLRSLGYDLTLADLVLQGQGVVGRMQAALLLTQRGYTKSTQDAFETVLGFGKPGYIERPRPSLQEAIWQIRCAGGVPVLAHPANYHWCEERPVVSQKLIRRLQDAKHKGLCGVEAFHGEASRRACLEISAAARYLGLIRTCGSDDHGSNKKTTALYQGDSNFLAGREILVTGALIRAGDHSWLLPSEAGTATGEETVGPHRYLLARRATASHGHGQWELPGGKVEPGETPQEALRREIHEEMGLLAEIGPLAELLTHDYDGFRIILACFHVQLAAGELELTAHDQIVWATAREALDLDVLAADVALFTELAAKEG